MSGQWSWVVCQGNVKQLLFFGEWEGAATGGVACIAASSRAIVLVRAAWRPHRYPGLTSCGIPQFSTWFFFKKMSSPHDFPFCEKGNCTTALFIGSVCGYKGFIGMVWLSTGIRIDFLPPLSTEPYNNARCGHAVEQSEGGLVSTQKLNAKWGATKSGAGGHTEDFL